MIMVHNYLAGTWRRVRAPMAIGFPWFGMSTELNLNGICEIAIGANFTAMTILAVVLAVSNSSTMMFVGLEPETNTKMHQRFNNKWLQ